MGKESCFVLSQSELRRMGEIGSQLLGGVERLHVRNCGAEGKIVVDNEVRSAVDRLAGGIANHSWKRSTTGEVWGRCAFRYPPDSPYGKARPEGERSGVPFKLRVRMEEGYFWDQREGELKICVTCKNRNCDYRR